MTNWQTPAVVIVFLTWLFAPPSGLADIARREALRRELTPKATRSLTNLDVAAAPPRPVPTVPASTAAALAGKPEAAVDAAAKPGADAKKDDAESHDEAWWRARMTAARKAVERDQMLAEALQSRINALTNDASARDDPAQRADLYAQRARVLDELEKMKEQIASDKKAIDDAQEEARKQGVPPGWIRGN